MKARHLAIVSLAAILLGAAGGAARAATGTVKGTVTSGAPATPVANAVVMIEGPSAPATGDLHVTMDQKGDAFVPHVIALPVGTTVDFPNGDPRLHNVFSTSPAKKFDLGMYGEGESRNVTFDAPGVVRVLCNVHPKMEAFVVVHANPYLAVTDAKGSYTITGVPPGSYEVRVWHERLPEKSVKVTVREGQVQPLDVRLDARH
jgi:plastocyanin